MCLVSFWNIVLFQRTVSERAAGNITYHFTHFSSTRPPVLSDIPLLSFFLPQRLSNGSLEPAHEASQVVELQDLLEKQNYELAQMKERMSSLSSRVSEVEQELETARKDLIKSEEMNNKYQRDIKEVTTHVRTHTHSHALTHTHTRRAKGVATVARDTSKNARPGL